MPKRKKSEDQKKSAKITHVDLISKAQKDLESAPRAIQESFKAWVEKVNEQGLIEVRKVPGYNDEALHGKLKGTRSIRLNKAWRAYYTIKDGEIKIVLVEGIDKHKYGK